MTQDVPQGFAAAAADFEAMAHRFWSAWTDTMRQAANPGMPPQASSPFSASGPGMPGPGVPGMGVPGGGFGTAQDPFAWWTQHVQGPAMAQDVAGRFDALARHWYAQMHQLAAHFAGRDNSAADVTEVWRHLLQAGGGNPFVQLFAMAQRQPGAAGPGPWMGQAASWLPWLQALRGQAHDWLRMPAFGAAREHQERWQALASAQIALQEKLEAYGALMGRVLEDALQRFERKLAEREAPGLGIDTPRALFDLWIDAAENAYAPVAMGPEFRRVYGELVDAQMRVRQHVQREVEQVCALFDMPTRTELDGAHRKIVELERQVRRLRDAVARMAGAAGTAAPDGRETSASRKEDAAKPPGATAARDVTDASVGPISASRKTRAASGSRSRAGKAPAERASAKTASQDSGSQAAPATRTPAVEKRAGTTLRRDAQPARPQAGQGSRSVSKAAKRSPAQRAARIVATTPTRRGQAALFSPAHAMPAAPRPLKPGKRKR